MNTPRVLLIALCFIISLRQVVGIVGGDEAEPHSVPYQAYLNVTGNDGSSWRCGGSLITPNYILTAARCCSGATSVEVILGAHDISKEEDTQVRLQSKDLTIHPQFETHVPNFVYVMDIAVVALPQTIEVNDYIQTIRLPPSSHPFKYTNITGRISGWGLTDGFDDTSYPSVLLSQKHTIISNEECVQVYFDLKSYDICMDTGKTDSPCIGDYGSPLVVDDVQVGIASQNVMFCIPGYAFLYTRVSDFLSWVQEATDYKDEDYGTTSSEIPETTSTGDGTTTISSTGTTESTYSDRTTEWKSTTPGKASAVFVSMKTLVTLVLLSTVFINRMFR